MNKYKVTGVYTINWTKVVMAEDEDDAREIAESIDIDTEWNGSSVFVSGDDEELEACGIAEAINIEYLQGDDDDEN